MSERDVRVCFVGDSFVAGTGDAAGLGWVGRVTAASFARGVPLTSYNLGIRGDTSTLIRDRLVAEAEPRLAAATDRRIVVSFGVNDTVLDNDRMRTPTIRSLRALHQMHRDRNGAQMLVVGPPAVADDEHNDRIRTLDDLMQDVARILRMPYVPTFADTVANATWRQKVHAGDGFHPDAEGYDLLANLVGEPILDWLAPA